MKATLLPLFIFLFTACSPSNSSTANSLSDFIKAGYSHQQSFLDCELLPDQNLSSVERFIPKLVERLNQIRDSDDEMLFLFPIQDNNLSISNFKVVLNHKDTALKEEMASTLKDLSFDQIAACGNKKSASYGRVSLMSHLPNSNSLVVEVMECKYLEGFNYATMKLVFEEFIDAVTKFDKDIAIVYSESLEDTSNFRWFNVFESIEDRKVFLEAWQALVVSGEMQTLFLEQSICASSNLFKSYKVI